MSIGGMIVRLNHDENQRGMDSGMLGANCVSFNFGNANSLSPIEIYNTPEFNKIRKLHILSGKNNLKKCKNCTVHYSVLTKENA